MKLAVDLKAERLNRGLSAGEAAEVIGIQKNILLRAEAGEGMPHPRNAKKVADFYGYKVTEVWPLEEAAA